MIEITNDILFLLKKERGEYLKICDENNRGYIQSMLDDSNSGVKIESPEDLENYLNDFGIEDNDDDIIYTSGVLAGIDTAMRIIQAESDDLEADLDARFGVVSWDEDEDGDN